MLRCWMNSGLDRAWGRNVNGLIWDTVTSLKEMRGSWKLKEEALDRTLWRTRFGRSYGPVVRQTTGWMNEWIKIGTANWHDQILHRNCLLKHVIEEKIRGNIEMTRRRWRRRKELLDDLKEKRRYCKLKEEALDRTLRRTRCGRGYGPVVRQSTEWVNEW
jgi:hypothetical protein